MSFISQGQCSNKPVVGQKLQSKDIDEICLTLEEVFSITQPRSSSGYGTASNEKFLRIFLFTGEVDCQHQVWIANETVILRQSET